MMANYESTVRGRHSPIMETLEPRLLLNAVRIPWVAGVTTSSVYVCLEATNNTQNAVVNFGLTTSYGSQAVTENAQPTDNNYVHNVKLTGLLPNTVYHYKITHGSSVSSDYTFMTAPLPGTSAHWGFAADCRPDTSLGDVSRHNNMAALIDSHDPTMMVYGGDLVYGSYWANWNKEWLTVNQAALNATTPWVNAVGNHEAWFNSLTQGFTQGPSGDDYYFSFDYGDAHILVLSDINNSTMPYGPGSAQWNFAAANLAASTAAWKIVAFHCPAYAWGSHGGDALMQQMTTQIFEPNGVNIVLAGHNHYYQHNLVNGIHHMVIGTFGVSPSTPSSSPTYTVATEASLAFGMFDTTPTSLTLTTYRENGSVIETIQLYKDATPPTVPGNLSASALGNDRVQLAWAASSDPESGVDHYNVYRGGALVGTTSLTSYTDTGLNEQTTYSYQVSAVNGDQQESAKSVAAVVTTPADTAAPTISSVAWASGVQVNVLFSEPVEKATAEGAANYVVYSSDQYVRIFSATLQADNRTVALSVSELSESKTYTVSVSNVRDRAAAPNTIVPDSQRTFAFAGWPSQDVGGPLAAGSSSYSAGTYTIQADGTDIYGSSDQCHYAYTTLAGNGEIIARVVSVPNLWAAKGGVMMRDNLDGNSPEVCMVLAGQVSEGYFQYRTTVGGSTGYASVSVNAPYYVRVVRNNGVFSGYISSSGQSGTWTQVGSNVTVSAMASGMIYVGLAGSSHLSGTLGTFVIDNVQLIDYGAPANTAPTAAAENYQVNPNGYLSVSPASGVLRNDTDAENDSLTAVPVGSTSHGSLALSGNGSFGYTPAAGFYGTDSFVYKPSDGSLAGNQVAVTMYVALPGDVNMDRIVDSQDFTILKSRFGLAGAWGDGDFNCDGIIDSQDFTILKANFGNSAPIGQAAPGEPAGAVLAAAPAEQTAAPSESDDQPALQDTTPVVVGAAASESLLLSSPDQSAGAGKTKTEHKGDPKPGFSLLSGVDAISLLPPKALSKTRAGKLPPSALVVEDGSRNSLPTLGAELGTELVDILAELRAQMAISL
jgi:hypothetical protein